MCSNRPLPAPERGLASSPGNISNGFGKVQFNFQYLFPTGRYYMREAGSMSIFWCLQQHVQIKGQAETCRHMLLTAKDKIERKRPIFPKFVYSVFCRRSHAPEHRRPENVVGIHLWFELTRVLNIDKCRIEGNNPVVAWRSLYLCFLLLSNKFYGNRAGYLFA